MIRRSKGFVYQGFPLAIVLLIASSCSDRHPADLPVWTPEDHKHPNVQSDERSAPDQELSEEESVALLWMEACATCHGSSGRGDGPAAPSDIEMQDLSDAEWQTSTSDEAIATVIENGREQMPSYGPAAPPERRLNPLGIRALVRHIRRLGAVHGAD